MSLLTCPLSEVLQVQLNCPPSDSFVLHLPGRVSHASFWVPRTLNLPDLKCFSCGFEILHLQASPFSKTIPSIWQGPGTQKAQ